MSERALVLLIAAVAGLALMGIYRFYRARFGGTQDRLDVDALGLELMSGCCAFVVFTTPACQPCKAALRVVSSAAEKTPGLTEVTTLDAVERSDLAIRYGVRTIPTTFLITASGHVIKEWKDVPDPGDVETALAAI